MQCNIYNQERRAGTNQRTSLFGMMALVNELTRVGPVTFLGFSIGGLITNNGISGPGMGIWLGVGPIKPDTGYYDTVICIQLERFILGTAKHTPTIYTNLHNPQNIEAIKQGIAKAIDSIPFEFDLHGEETEAGADGQESEFFQFMKGIWKN